MRCVQALLRQTIADQIEVVVIDNHSEDDSIGVLRNRLGIIPNVRIVEAPRNLGYGAGNNRGERLACGEFLLIVNPDNELEPWVLERMVQAMRGDSSIGILAPRLVYPDGTVRDSARAFPTFVDVFIKRTALRRLFPGRLRRYLQQGEQTPAMRDTDWVAGACFLIRRSLFRELSGFDERFFLFFEDTDLCRRCRQRGLRVVYFPEVTAFDRKRRLSGGGLLSLLVKSAGRAHLLSALKYFWKWRHAS